MCVPWYVRAIDNTTSREYRVRFCRSMKLCHNFVIEKEHTRALKTTCVLKAVERRRECRAHRHPHTATSAPMQHQIIKINKHREAHIHHQHRYSIKITARRSAPRARRTTARTQPATRVSVRAEDTLTRLRRRRVPLLCYYGQHGGRCRPSIWCATATSELPSQ